MCALVTNIRIIIVPFVQQAPNTSLLFLSFYEHPATRTSRGACHPPSRSYRCICIYHNSSSVSLCFGFMKMAKSRCVLFNGRHNTLPFAASMGLAKDSQGER